MKKLFLLPVCAVLASTSADAVNITHSFNVGAMAGVRVDHVDVKGSHYSPISGSKVNMTSNSSDHNFSGGFLLGYDALINQFLLGIEANVQFSNTESKSSTREDDNDGISTGLNGKTRYGAALKFGYVVENVIYYLKAGLMFQKLDFKVDIQNPAGGQSPNASNSKTQMAFVPGIGIEHRFSDCNSLGLEYNAEIYRKISASAINPVVGDADTNMNAKLISHSINLVYRYRFNLS